MVGLSSFDCKPSGPTQQEDIVMMGSEFAPWLLRGLKISVLDVELYVCQRTQYTLIKEHSLHSRGGVNIRV